MPLLFALILLLIPPQTARAEETGLAFGLGAEVNGVSLVGPRLAFILNVESRISRLFSLGARGTVSLLNAPIDAPTGTPASFDFGDPDYLMGFEAVVTPRYYMISGATGSSRSLGFEWFLELDIGVLNVMRGFSGRDSRGSPEVGVASGFRLLFGRHFYIEPYGRFGYPYLYGAGLLIGSRFPREEQTFLRERVVEREWVVEVEKQMQYEVFVIIFAPDTDVFDGPGLSDDIRAQNRTQLKRVAALLEEHPVSRVLIEGNANPVTGTVDEESEALMPLSVRRANRISEALEEDGIPSYRTVRLGEGGTRTIAPMEDRDNWYQNRRVEMRVLW
jgi:outer membrane protein OmpA-like peptidoglycan-associated protein